MYTEIHVGICYVNWDTKQSSVTRQNAKTHTNLSVALTSVQLTMCWIGPHRVLWLLQCCQTSFPLLNQEQRFEDHHELPWLDVHCMVHCLAWTQSHLNHWESSKTNGKAIGMCILQWWKSLCLAAVSKKDADQISTIPVKSRVSTAIIFD